MQDSSLRPLLPLLVVAVLGAFTPFVAHHVPTFMGLSGLFWASAMLMLEITLLCIGLAAVRNTTAALQRIPLPLRSRENLFR